MPSDKYELKATPRKSKGSLTAQTYEFPIMNQRDERTLRQIIYDSSNGKILGRTSSQWGKKCRLLSVITIFSLNPDRATSDDNVCSRNQQLKPRKCLLKLFLRLQLTLAAFQGWETMFIYSIMSRARINYEPPAKPAKIADYRLSNQIDNLVSDCAPN